MSASVEKLDGNRFLVKGAINFDNAEALVKQGVAALKEASGSASFDLSGVQHSNSVGLSVLLSWMRTAKAQGVQISFVGMPSTMFDIARVSGLDDVLPIQRATR